MVRGARAEFTLVGIGWLVCGILVHSNEISKIFRKFAVEGKRPISLKNVKHNIRMEVKKNDSPY